jgi:hypothetical protein
MGFWVDKVAQAKVFSEYLDFPCQFSFHKLLRVHKSFYYQCYVVSILRASLDNRTTKTKNNKALYSLVNIGR